ncbi:MAG: hypothetical protein LAQ30_25105 [Acidobacteriia bacterium]|nr:hypothetical protein [Terriglobia bacterium]
MSGFGLEAAIRAWKGAVGAENVITEPVELARAETGTFATRNRVPAIVRISIIAGLTPNTYYYVRAYATNDAGSTGSWISTRTWPT